MTFLVNFSAFSNTKRLFDVNIPKNSNHLGMNFEFDVMIFQKSSLCNVMLYCYSISNPNSSLGCLDGLRFISMTWVVLGHASFAIISQMKNMGFAFKVL